MKTHQTRWIKREQPAPIDTRLERAKKLPMFGPGIVIKIPLSLLPEYLQLYRLKPAGLREPRFPSKDGPGEEILLVKRGNKDV